MHSGRDLAGETGGGFLRRLSNLNRACGTVYRPAHLAKLASLNRGQALERVSAWLDSAIDFITLEWNEDEPAEQRHYPWSRCVRKQYVVRMVQDYRKDGTTVEGYPNEEVIVPRPVRCRQLGSLRVGSCTSATRPANRSRPAIGGITFKGMRQDFFANAASEHYAG